MGIEFQHWESILGTELELTSKGALSGGSRRDCQDASPTGLTLVRAMQSVIIIYTIFVDIYRNDNNYVYSTYTWHLSARNGMIGRQISFGIRIPYSYSGHM